MEKLFWFILLVRVIYGSTEEKSTTSTQTTTSTALEVQSNSYNSLTHLSQDFEQMLKSPMSPPHQFIHIELDKEMDYLWRASGVYKLIPYYQRISPADERSSRFVIERHPFNHEWQLTEIYDYIKRAPVYAGKQTWLLPRTPEEMNRRTISHLAYANENPIKDSIIAKSFEMWRNEAIQMKEENAMLHQKLKELTNCEEKTQENEAASQKLKQETIESKKVNDKLKSSTNQHLEQESQIHKNTVTNQKQNVTQMKKQNKGENMESKILQDELKKYQQIQKLKEELEIHKTQIKNQKHNLAQMKKQNKDLEQRNIELSEQNKEENIESEKLYNELKSSTDQQIQKLKEESEIYKTQINSQKQNLTQMKKQNKDLEQKNIELLEKNKNSEQQIETLTEQVTKNENQNEQRARTREEIMKKHKAQIQKKDDDLEKAHAHWKDAMNTLRKDFLSEVEAKEKNIQRSGIRNQVSKKDVSAQVEILKPSSKTNKEVLVQTDEMGEISNPNDEQPNNVLNANPLPEDNFYDFDDEIIWIKNMPEMQKDF